MHVSGSLLKRSLVETILEDNEPDYKTLNESFVI